MPRGDRTGPMGLGPMTGRRGGFCAGFTMPGALNPTAGWPAWGGGRGWRNWFHATGLPGWVRGGMRASAWCAGPYPSTMPVAPAMPPEIEVNTLKAQAGYLEQTLQTLRQRIQTLESESKNE